MKKITHLQYVKETKNTYVYAAQEDDTPLIPSLYIRKDALGTDAPKTLKITVEG